MKNNMQDFMGAGTDGYKDIRLLQIMPLPENMTVMVVDTDDDDNVVMRDCVETSNCYCLALAEDGGETVVYPYALTDWNGFDTRASIVPVRQCPKCGKRMQPHMEEGEGATLHYTCACGYTEPGWLDLKNETDERTAGNEIPQYGSRINWESEEQPMAGVKRVLRAAQDKQYEIEALVERERLGFDVATELETANRELQEEQKKIAGYAYRLCHYGQEIVIIDRYIRQWTWEKIAESLRINVQKVYKLHGEALLKIKKMIENDTKEDKTNE